MKVLKTLIRHFYFAFFKILQTIIYLNFYFNFQYFFSIKFYIIQFQDSFILILKNFKFLYSFEFYKVK